MNKPLDKKILIWTVLLILISSIPVFMGFMKQNEQWSFSGFVMNIDDGNSYITKMMQGYQGDWLYRAPYSLEPQKGLLVFLPYIILGKLVSPPAIHTQMVVLFHLFRVLAIAVMIYGVNRFIKLFQLKNEYHLLVLVLSTAGGGTGWLIILLGQSNFAGWLPLEFISPEGFGFISAYTIPHLAMARGLLFGSIAFFIEGISFWEENGRYPKYKWLLCAAGLFLMGIFQPLYCAIAVLWIALVSMITFTKKRIMNKIRLKDFLYTLLVCVPAGVWIGYILIMGWLDPYMNAWNTQNLVLSPPISLFVISYGLFYLFGIINMTKLRVATNSTQGKLLLILAIIIPILIYIPFNLQRRLLEGLWVSLLILTMLIVQNSGNNVRKISKVVFSILSVPSTIIILIMGIQATNKPASPVYVNNDALKIYKTAEELSANGNILTSFRTGNEITAWFPVRVSLGHGSETIHYKKFNKMYLDYVNGQTDSGTRLSWLEQYNIRYAIVERSQIDNMNDADTFGNEVYSSGNWFITEIIP